MEKRANIIIFLADDLGYDDLGCYGSRLHATPNLDALAARGVLLTDCHSNGVMCSPSRAALLTGRYQQRCGLEYVLGPDPVKWPGMPEHELTFAHLFKEAGYATGMFGKYHTGHIPHQSPRKMGFDIFRGNNGGMDHHSRFNRWGEGVWYHDETMVENEEGYSTDLISDHAIDFISAHRDRPFLCYVADWMVHFPWQGPNDPIDFTKGVDNSAPEKKYGSVVDRKRAYREMVEAMDANVGRIVRHVEELGLGEETFFFFTSDNGGHELICDNHPLNGAKGSTLEGGHRVPAIACWPGTVPPQAPLADTVMLTDLFATMLEIGGIAPPAGRHLDSLSLLPLLTRREPLVHRRLFWRQGEQFAVREGAWKYVVHSHGQGLFNLDDDLGESVDLSSLYPERVAALREAFSIWSAEVDADGHASRNHPGGIA